MTSRGHFYACLKGCFWRVFKRKCNNAFVRRKIAFKDSQRTRWPLIFNRLQSDKNRSPSHLGKHAGRSGRWGLDRWKERCWSCFWLHAGSRTAFTQISNLLLKHRRLWPMIGESLRGKWIGATGPRASEREICL